MHHPLEPTVDDGVGGFNNVIRVTEADAEVFRALDVDAEETDKKRSLKKKYKGPISKDFGQVSMTKKYLSKFKTDKFISDIWPCFEIDFCYQTDKL